MAIESAGVALTPSGHIIVNERQETNVGHIYAAGDCTNTPAFVFTAATISWTVGAEVLKCLCISASEGK